MIIWLASYPRSGNSLLRLMLFRVFGMKSFSHYGDGGDIADKKIAECVGHQSLGEPFDQIYEDLKSACEVYPVKTHEIPIDSQKTIYIVRDGRSASKSYSRYRMDFNGCTNEAQQLRNIILGFNSFGSWSNHLDMWDPLNRPNTLLLKYEDLIQSPNSEIPRISAFLNLEPRQSWQNNFEELARLEPRYFRAAAANRPENALAESDLQLFWMMHAKWMRRLNYASHEEIPATPEISDLLRQSLYHAVADQIGQLATITSRAQQCENEARLQTVETESARQLVRAAEEKIDLLLQENCMLRHRVNAAARSRLQRAADALRLKRRPAWLKKSSHGNAAEHQSLKAASGT